MTELARTTCLNCGNAVNDNFCARCGQKSSVGRISVKETFSHFASVLFSFEGPFLLTLSELFKNPGKVAREYIEGKRVHYYKPLSFFVVMTAVYLILRSAVDYNPLEGRVAEDPNIEDPTIRFLMVEATKYMVAHINNILFTLVIGYATTAKLLFWKKYNWSEFAVPAFYLCGMYMIIGMISILIATYFEYDFQYLMLWILGVLNILMTATFFNNYSVSYFLRYVLVAIGTVAIYVTIGFGIAFLMVYIQYET